VSGLIPANAGQVGAALGNLSRELGRVNHELTAAQKLVGQLTRSYQRAFDLVLIKLTNPPGDESPVLVTVAKAMARVDPEVYALGLALDVAKSNVQRLSNDFEELQDRIRVGQTNAATIRSEARTIGYS
jgi:hypothetical protein